MYDYRDSNIPITNLELTVDLKVGTWIIFFSQFLLLVYSFVFLKGEIFPATFPDKGPESSLRSARNLTGSPEVIDVYDCLTGLMKIGPFNYKPLRGVDLWMEQSDDFILR